MPRSCYLVLMAEWDMTMNLSFNLSKFTVRVSLWVKFRVYKHNAFFRRKTVLRLIDERQTFMALNR